MSYSYLRKWRKREASTSTGNSSFLSFPWKRESNISIPSLPWKRESIISLYSSFLPFLSFPWKQESSISIMSFPYIHPFLSFPCKWESSISSINPSFFCHSHPRESRENENQVSPLAILLFCHSRANVNPVSPSII